MQAELESLISVHRIKEMETSEHIEDVRQMRDEMATLIAGNLSAAIQLVFFTMQC